MIDILRPMQTLILIAAVCCAVLLAACIALWWSMRRKPDADEPEAAPLRPVVSLRKRPHPRLDLAAGVVPPFQSVRRAPRRRGVAREEDLAETVKAERARRPDWAYYNENMGDLSDPDLRRAPAGGVRRPMGTVSVPESR